MIQFIVAGVLFGSAFGLANDDISLESPPNLVPKALEGLVGEDIYLNKDGTVSHGNRGFPISLGRSGPADSAHSIEKDPKQRKSCHLL